jgi:hypothetical protein
VNSLGTISEVMPLPPGHLLFISNSRKMKSANPRLDDFDVVWIASVSEANAVLVSDTMLNITEEFINPVKVVPKSRPMTKRSPEAMIT